MCEHAKAFTFSYVYVLATGCHYLQIFHTVGTFWWRI